MKRYRFNLSVHDEESTEQKFLIDIPINFMPDGNKLNTAVMNFLTKEEKRQNVPVSKRGITKR